LQNRKHATKTACNNCMTGISILALGDQLHDIAFSDINQGPLLHQDVERSDCHDDHAAAQVFSAPLLEHLAQTCSEGLGLIVYTFIHGQLLDALENRCLLLVKRIEMVLRAKFLLAGWKHFVD
ncbi:hypothetical protein BT69DRAFT_1202231, partial [Atractiella rhizophila]